MVARFDLSSSSCVAEIAANDGYLLQFVRSRGIPCIGIEPTASTAAAARARGIDIVEAFFGKSLARNLVEQDRQADLMVANNVLAHVPDINDFVSGFALLLKPEGVATFEFPHLLRLLNDTQFDTIYHEHFSYLSLTTVDRIFAANGLRVFDVEELSTHGGSLRVFAQRTGAVRHPRDSRVEDVLRRELLAGICSAAVYEGFQASAENVKDDFLAFLLEAKRQGKSVAAYGAAAKGNTLLNFAGVRRDLIAFVVDQNPAKQDKFMPGSRIPIVDESALRNARPDYVLILPWNLKDALMDKLSYVREWDAQFVTAIPSLQTM
jgi:SAM-dependent methyltransferase